jgi:tripartite-type tricarboxylate transporter receptor subunit TctC
VPLAPQVRSGKLRGLAVTGPEALAGLPRTAGDRRNGAGYEVVNWFGILAPAGTPARSSGGSTRS